MRHLVVAAIALCAFSSVAAANSVRLLSNPGLEGYDVPFYQGGTWRKDVRTPDDVLGFPLGSRPATHGEVVHYFQYLADSFPNVQLHEYARSYEGRALVYLVVTSQANADRLEDIRGAIRRLADPRQLRRGSVDRLINDTPAVAWCAYAIHGDELSSSDAAVELAYQLVAGTDADTRRIRDNLVVLIDPMENPDGRMRWIGMMNQWRGARPNYDTQSLQHRGMWPYGRTNHYLFDLNRDWFATVHPESWGRTAAIANWMPQYALDAHEMGPTDTYLFSPPRAPFNPHLPDYTRKWWDRVAHDEAAAFDRYGWNYYTREWNEEFYPGYGSSWPTYLGAVGMLFEQAGVDGSAVRRPEGTLLTYREAVHHHFIGSFANLRTIAEGRKELLRDYFRQKLANVRSRPGAYLFVPSDNVGRFEGFLGKLAHQHIEFERATAPFRATGVTAPGGAVVRTRTFPAGTIVVRTNQPLRQLVDVILSFDVRMPTSFLRTEKRELLKHGRSRLYEVTGWSLPIAYGIESYYTRSAPRATTATWTPSGDRGGLSGENTRIGFAFSCADDRSFQLLARLFRAGIQVRASRKPFRDGDTVYPHGSYQIRLDDNPGLDVDELSALASQVGIEVSGLKSSLSGPPYADLGGDEFSLLRAPHIAVAGGDPVSITEFGAIWYLIDARIGLRATNLNVASLATTNLGRYNVLVLPSVSGGTSHYREVLGKSGIKSIRDWVHNGGTLVATGNAAAMLADTSVALSSVRIERQVLKKIFHYRRVLRADVEAESPSVDSLAVWEGNPTVQSAPDSGQNVSIDLRREADERARALAPRGVILRVDLDGEHWLTGGCPSSVSVLFGGSYAYLAPRGEIVAGRLADPGRLRLSGLLWPEARTRWARTAYATRERSGKGQVILFASLPNFRGYFHGAERLLVNALLLGPGFGARSGVEWNTGKSGPKEQQ